MAPIKRSTWVRKSRPVATLGGVEIGEIAELRRKCGAIGHLGAVDQHRNDRRLLRQRSLDLDPDRVRRFAHPYGAAGADAEPIRADHSQHDVGALQGFMDLSAKIGAERDIIDVHEHRFLAVIGRQVIENAAGDGGGIGAAIRDHDCRHRVRKPIWQPGS